MWVGGPPNPMHPMRPHWATTVRSGTGEALSGRRREVIGSAIQRAAGSPDRAESGAGNLGADAFANEVRDLAGRRVAPERLLREDELTVERHLEASVRSRNELDRFDDGSPTLQQLVRQTDGARNVVSGDAEFDEEPVPWVKHESLSSSQSASA